MLAVLGPLLGVSATSWPMFPVVDYQDSAQRTSAHGAGARYANGNRKIASAATAAKSSVR
jgi:hypothetical protein